MDSKIIIVLVFILELIGVFGLYITQVAEPSASHPEFKLDVYPARNERSIKMEGKTYGMSLTGDRGTVWNNLNDLEVSHHVGITNSQIEGNNEDKPKMKQSREEEETDKIKYNEDEAASKEEEPRLNVRSFEEQSSENPIFEKSSINEQNLEESSINAQKEELNSGKLNFMEQNLEKPSREESIIMQKNLEKRSPPKLGSNGVNMSGNTYGMSLTGDQGMVWNDLNGYRKAYKVGEPTAENIDSKFEDKRELKSKLDEEIDDKIITFKKDLEEAASNEELASEKPINDKPRHEEPQIEATSTEEPKKETKTYGMSLNGDHGTVWNDLNGDRISYEVGKSTEESKENTSEEDIYVPTKKPDLDEIIHNILKPSDESPEDSPNLPEMDAALDEIDRIFDGVTKKPEESQNDSNALVNEIVDIIKEVFKNESTKLEEKTKDCSKDNSSNKNEKNTDKDGVSDITTRAPFTNGLTNGNKNNLIIGNENNKNENDNDKTFQLPVEIRKLMENEQFWNWFNDWLTTYLELLMNRVDNHIKKEVSTQIEDYFATHKIPEDKIDNDERKTDGCDGNELREEELASKKRKDKDFENKNKETPFKIEAHNVYGNSLGNGNVTNIFIFNMSNTSGIKEIKPLNNGTNSFYIFGNDDEKTNVNNVSNNLEANKDSVENKKPENPDESPDLPNNQDKDTSTEKETPNVIDTEEKNLELTTEKPKEIIEVTTKNPINDDKEKDEAKKPEIKEDENLDDKGTGNDKLKEDSDKDTNKPSESGDNKDKDSVKEKENASEDTSREEKKKKTKRINKH